MPQAVRYSEHGGIDVLQVVDVGKPVPGPGQVLIRVRTAGINPVDAAIRQGFLQQHYPVTFPTGQGVDFAGEVEAFAEGVRGPAIGDEVLGFLSVSRDSQAEYVLATPAELVPKPAGVPWDVAGALYTAGTAAYASIRATGPRPGETVVVSAAAGGVGSIAVQLARRAGATVVGLAGPANHAWLRQQGVVPVAYGEAPVGRAGLAERILAAADGTPDAFIDTFGSGYVDLAVELGIAPRRINTVIDFEAAVRHGTHADGNKAAGTAEALTELAALVDKRELEVPIAATYPLADVRKAYHRLEQRHTHGKITLHL